MKNKRLYLLSLVVITGLLIVSYQLAIRQTSKPTYHDYEPEFSHIDPEKMTQDLSDRQPGIYYFGFPTCPWCIELLPVLDEALVATGTKAQVVNTRASNYTVEADSRVEKIYRDYVTNDQVSVPFLVFINNQGQIKTHVGTLPSHDASKHTMTKSEHQQLFNTLKTLAIWHTT